MRRFIVLTLLGGLIALVGHALISLGLHPERLATVPALLQGGAVLVIGAALFCTGMIGLADGYERVAAEADSLLHSRDLTQLDAAVAVRDRTGLDEAGQLFWRGYSRAGLGLSLFLAGLLALTAGLSRLSPTLFTVGVGSGVVILFFLSMSVCLCGLLRARRAHASVDDSTRRLARLPEYRPEPVRVPASRRRASRSSLFPRRSVGRGLDRAHVQRVERPREPATG
jgi:hypothetical protein